jgi:hypothetical protein
MEARTSSERDSHTSTSWSDADWTRKFCGICDPLEFEFASFACFDLEIQICNTLIKKIHLSEDMILKDTFDVCF